MQGKIKWFSGEKGYGYIFGDDEREYYFNVREVKGVDLPRNGDTVTFESGQGKKGPRATSVTITSKAPAGGNSNMPRHSDDRATCSYCGKKMVPRIIVRRGEPKKSVCPFCGRTHKKFGCFIATAVYGDFYAPEVIALRRFRDETLESSVIGRVFISLYYRYSPPVAAFLVKHPRLSALIRLPLNVLAHRNG